MGKKYVARAYSVSWWMSFVLCGVLLVAHFSVVQLSNMPLNPITLEYGSFVHGYVNPMFDQKWNFFAPHPIDRDISLLVRGQYLDQKSGSLKTTPWVDVTDPLIEALRRNRLTPLALVELGISNAVIGFENRMNKDPRAVVETNGKKMIRPIIPATIDPLDMDAMKRTGMATLEITFPGIPFKSVGLGLLKHEFPRFTQRDKQDNIFNGAITAVQWQKADWVAPYCCLEANGSLPAIAGQGR